MLLRRDVDDHAWIKIATPAFQLPLQGLHLLETLVVLDAHVLTLLLQTRTNDAEIVGECSHEDFIIVLKRLQHRVSIQLAHNLVLVEVINVESDAPQPVVLLVEHLLHQLAVLLKLLRDREFGQLRNHSLRDLRFEPA